MDMLEYLYKKTEFEYTEIDYIESTGTFSYN